MKPIALIIPLFVPICCIQIKENFPNVKVLDTSNQLSARNKRSLVWKEGVNWVALIFGIGIPFEVDEHSINMGMVMKAYYQLPNNSTYYTHPTINFERGKRSNSRWNIYKLLQNFIERNNYSDGKACLLKSICEVAAVRLEERSGLLAEIVHTVLTPSTTEEELADSNNYEYHAAEKLGKEFRDCNRIFPDCDVSPLEKFSRFMRIIKLFQKIKRYRVAALSSGFSCMAIYMY
ncbi:hypothetical protein HUJ04_006658 [Dendroctonus ponderosae]|nr:hypothetical protein HUJ04_006658 [Dendroctonus ponderosae]